MARLEDATKATVAFSTQHDALCRDVAKRASRKGVKDHDLYDVDDIEHEEAATIINESTEALLFDHRCALEDDGAHPVGCGHYRCERARLAWR